MILLMKEILHLGCKKSCKSRVNLPINWGRIPSINSIIIYILYMHELPTHPTTGPQSIRQFCRIAYRFAVEMNKDDEKRQVVSTV